MGTGFYPKDKGGSAAHPGEVVRSRGPKLAELQSRSSGPWTLRLPCQAPDERLSLVSFLPMVRPTAVVKRLPLTPGAPEAKGQALHSQCFQTKT
jgi:hypothetical protein